MAHDPQLYAISIQKVNTDGEELFEATIKEFPDASSYGETHNEAYELAIDFLNTSFEMLAEQGTEIPAPIKVQTDYSGRVTLRAPKNLHAKIVSCAEANGVSINSYMVHKLTEATTLDAALSSFDAAVKDSLFKFSSVVTSNSNEHVDIPILSEASAISIDDTDGKIIQLFS